MPLHPLPHLLDSPRWAGMRVGLLGGTFNPPHEGHVHISLAAMKALHLDAVWWLVTPQNPIKDQAPAPLSERMDLCRSIIKHPKIIVSDIETQIGETITYNVIRKLKTRYARTNFVWISGMDNANNLHKWNHWRQLLKEICMAHLTRPPATSLIKRSPLRLQDTQRHVVISKGGRYPLDSGTTYWMLQKKMINISSTALREKMNGISKG
jgi:nicotinate-nucleotide adenylyltransferase